MVIKLRNLHIFYLYKRFFFFSNYLTSYNAYFWRFLFKRNIWSQTCEKHPKQRDVRELSGLDWERRGTLRLKEDKQKNVVFTWADLAGRAWNHHAPQVRTSKPCTGSLFGDYWRLLHFTAGIPSQGLIFRN